MAGWRTVLISQAARLSLSHQQLKVEPKEGDAVTLPLTDVAAIILETPQCTLTSALLSACAKMGTVLFSCDDAHLPNGLFAPFGTHSRHTKNARLQMGWSEPFKKRCWQKIIQAKITNQAELLKRIGQDSAARRLQGMVEQVGSGDPKNHESQAASLYWRALFPNFLRTDTGVDVRNGALNYGYAILRGALARSIVAHGFLPAFGLHHQSELNSYNLADDLIEPFRPLLDARVRAMFADERDVERFLEKEDRVALAEILGVSCLIGGEKESLLHACEKVVESLLACTLQKSAQALVLPTFADA